jgi:negative regulator of sigma E activity
VFIAPPAWATGVDDPAQVVVRENFGLTVVSGQVPLEEAKRVAEGLNH